MEEEGLREQLCTLDEAVGFLILIVAGVLLSFRATWQQREALAAALCGGEGDAPSVYPLRHRANSLIVGALVYFFCLAIQSWQQAEGEARESARANGWAALLVLAAAVIRYRELERSQGDT